MKKWTIIDTLIVIAAVAVLATAWVMFGPSKGGKTEAQSVDFTILLSEREKGLSETMKAGDKVILSYEEKDSGIIKAIKANPSEVMVYDGIEGVYRNEINEEKEDIYVTITAECEISDKWIKTGDTAIKVGQETPIRGKGYTAKGFVIEITD